MVTRPKRAFFQIWSDTKAGRFAFQGSMPADAVTQTEFDSSKWTTLVKTREFKVMVNKNDGAVVIVTHRNKVFKVANYNSMFWDMKAVVDYFAKHKKYFGINRYSGREVETLKID